MSAHARETRPLALTPEALEAFIATRNYKREHGAVCYVNTDKLGVRSDFAEGYAYAMAEVFDLLEGRLHFAAAGGSPHAPQPPATPEPPFAPSLSGDEIYAITRLLEIYAHPFVTELQTRLSQQKRSASISGATVVAVQDVEDQHLAASERRQLRTVDERDQFHEWADKLAYALFRIEDIGEHSSGNNPWANALERLEALAAASQAIPAPPPASRPGEVFTVNEHNIAKILIDRFASGDPGSGLALTCHESHALMVVLAKSIATPPASQGELHNVCVCEHERWQHGETIAGHYAMSCRYCACNGFGLPVSTPDASKEPS